MAAMTLKSPIIAGGHPAGIYSDMSVDGPTIGTLVLIIDKGKNLPNRKSMGKQDPYCAARLGKEAHKTKIDKRGGQTPRWDQELRFVVHDSTDYYALKISCFHDDKRTELIGETFVDLKDVICPGGGQSDQWVNLKCREKYAGEIRIEMTYYDSRPKEEKPVVEKRKEPTRPNNISRESAVGGARQLRIPRRPLPANPTGGSPAQASLERAIPGIATVPHLQHVAQPRVFERDLRNYQPPPSHLSNPYDFDLPPRGQSEVYLPQALPTRSLDNPGRAQQDLLAETSNHQFYDEGSFVESDQIQNLRNSRGSHRGDDELGPAPLQSAVYSQIQETVPPSEPYIAQSAPASHSSVPNFQQFNQYPQTPERSAPQVPAHKPTERSKSWNQESTVQAPQHNEFLLENSYVSEPQEMEDSPPPPPPPAHRTFGTPTEVHSVAPLSSKRASPQPHGSPPEIPSASKPLSLHRAVTDYNAHEFAVANGSPVGTQQDIFNSSSQPELIKSTSPFDRRRLSNRPAPETYQSQSMMEHQSPPRRLSGDGLFQSTTPTKQPPPVPANRPMTQDQWTPHRLSGPPSNQQTPERPENSHYTNMYQTTIQQSSSQQFYQQDTSMYPEQAIPDESTLHRRRRSTEVARLSLGRDTGSPKSQLDADSPPTKQNIRQNAPPHHRNAHSDSSVIEAQALAHSAPKGSGYSPPAQPYGHIRHARSFGSPEHEKPDLDPYRRRSHSPQPPHEPSSPLDDRQLAGTPFSPDSYNVLNPKAADGSLSKSISKSYQQKAPLYTSNPVQVRNMPKQRRVSPRLFRRTKEPVITPDRIVDPSDHLPSDTWAPEPERKAPTAQPDARRQAPQGAQPMPMSAKRAPRTTTSIFNRPRPHSIAGPIDEPESQVKGSPMRLFDRNRLRKSRASTVEPTPVPSSPPGPPAQTSTSANTTPAKSPYDYSWLQPTPPHQNSPASQMGSVPRSHRDRTHYSPMNASKYEYQSSPPANNSSDYSGLPPPIPNKIPLGTPERRDQWSLEDELRNIDIGSSGGRRSTRIRQAY